MKLLSTRFVCSVNNEGVLKSHLKLQHSELIAQEMEEVTRLAKEMVYGQTSKPVELGYLKDFELEVDFKPEAKPIFCKPRPVPLAILENLNDAYEDENWKEVWKPTGFNAYGTLVVPVRKAIRPGQKKANIRTCRDYSEIINPRTGDSSSAHTTS